MACFPYYLLSHGYTLGTPKWTIIDNGLLATRMGNGMLRVRDRFGQAIYAIDCRIDHANEDDAGMLWDFWQLHKRGVSTFDWPCLLRCPEAAAYSTFLCRFDPDTPPKIEPHGQGYRVWTAEWTLLPILPTVAVEMLVAWWPMDEGGVILEIGTDTGLEVGTDTGLAIGGGEEVIDATGNGHTGTACQATSLMAAAGKIGGALDFDGADDYVAVADATDLRLTDGGGIAAWIYPDGLGESSEGRIVDKSAAVDAGAGYAFALAAGNKLAFRVAGDGEWTLSPANAITLAAWQHVAVSFSAQGRRLYVNGVDVTDTGGTLTSLPPSSTAGLRIGNRAGSTDRSFNGKIDDVRIYKRPLCLQEWQAIYNDGDGTALEVVT